MAHFLLLSCPRDRTPNREAISPRVLRAIERGLSTLGHSAVSRNYRPELVTGIAHDPTIDIVFNLVYGYVDSCRHTIQSQPAAAATLATLPQPIVGSEPHAQARAQDKLVCAQFLSNQGVEVPAAVLRGSGRRPPLVVVKPRYGSCHRDVRVIPYQEVDFSHVDPDTLVEEYVAGAEYTVGVTEHAGGPRALPPLEIVFPQDGRPHVLGSSDQVLGYALADRDPHGLTRLSERVFTMLGLRDYARFDFRISHDRGPVLLDANALPNLDPHRSFLPIAARMAGISFPVLLGWLVEGAIQRLIRTRGWTVA